MPKVDDRLFSELYDAVVTGNIDACRKWLGEFALHAGGDHHHYEETMLSVGEKVYGEFRKIGGNTAASKYITMTEVLTGFSEERFMFLGEGALAPDVVDLAGKLSAAAEDAIMNESDALAETLEAERETRAEAAATNTSRVAALEHQIKALDERLVLEMGERGRLVEQSKRFPPERMKMLEVQNEQLEAMLSETRDQLEAQRKLNQDTKLKYDTQRQQALGEMQLRHKKETKRMAAGAKAEKRRALADRDEATRTEIERLVTEHDRALAQLKDESEEPIFALTEIHNERLQEAENLKMQALGNKEASHKDFLRELKKELKRTRLNSTEHLNATKTAHVRVIAEMESSHRDTVRALQLQLFRLRKEMASSGLLGNSTNHMAASSRNAAGGGGGKLGRNRPATSPPRGDQRFLDQDGRMVEERRDYSTGNQRPSEGSGHVASPVDLLLQGKQFVIYPPPKS